MTDSFVQLPDDGTGKKLDTRQMTQSGGDVVQRETVAIGDPSDVDAVAPVSATDGLGVDIGPVDVISSSNSTSTPLGSSATYAGTGEDILRYASVSITLYAEPSNASGTLYFEFSTDNTNWDVSIPVVVSNPTIQVPIPLRTVARYFRVRYVNDTTVQTALRLQTILHRVYPGALVRALDTQILTTEPVTVTRSVLTGQTPAGTFSNVMSTDGNALLTDDFLNEVAIGNVSGYSIVEKFGRNGDIDIGTAPEDVWLSGGNYTGQPTGSAETIEVFSSDAADTSAGTGARTVRLVGLDANYDEQTVDVTLSGVTPVATTETWLRMFRMFVLTAGSGGENAGTLTARHTTTTANVFAVISPGFNQSQIAAYTIPNNKTGYVRALYISNALASGGNGSAEVALRIREPGGVFRARRAYEITQASQVNLELSGVLTLPEHTDIKWRVESVSDNNTIVNGEFTILLVDD